MRANARSPRPVRGPDAHYAVKHYLRLCESLDTPVSLSCYLLAKYAEWDQLVTKKVAPERYLSDTCFRPDYLAVSVLSKADFLPTTFDRRQVAVESFWAAEEQCRASNERLTAYSESRLMPADPEVHAVLHRAREFILRTLGESPSEVGGSYKLGLRRREAFGGFKPRFGPGSTSLVKRYIHAAEKYRRQVDVTPSLYPFWRDIAGPRWAAHIHSVTLNACNRVTFVPKNAKTYRAIAIEPHLNGYAQLGIAGLIRHCLLRIGIDLSVQADVNRSLAEVAQALGLATIDLKSASDTVCRALIWLLFPEKWAQLLDAARCSHGELNGVQFEYEKFSSMGNGFTFEVETLIFYALARASGGSQATTSVFGDDIVTEADVAPLLIRALDFCGFAVNVEKTFTSGPFRESCGRDFFLGVDVRPFFWKELDVALWFKVPNDVRSLATTKTCSPGEKKRLLGIWHSACSAIPPALDHRVPPGYGSFGVVDRPPARVYTLKDGWDGYRFKATTFDPKTLSVDDNEAAMLWCLDGGTYEGKAKASFRGMGKWRTVWLSAFGAWPDDGAWD